jgi:hypothetical protein
MKSVLHFINQVFFAELITSLLLAVYNL